MYTYTKIFPLNAVKKEINKELLVIYLLLFISMSLLMLLVMLSKEYKKIHTVNNTELSLRDFQEPVLYFFFQISNEMNIK